MGRSNMPIDPGKVQWDSGEPAGIKWDAPAEPDLKRQLAESTPAYSPFSRDNALTISAGKMGDSMWEGLKQSGMGVGAIFSELLPARLKRAAQEELTKRLLDQQKRQAENAKEYKNLEEAHPIATALGESVPLVAMPTLRAVPGAGAMPAMANAGISSAIPAALEYGDVGERGAKAGVMGASGVVGSGAMSAAGKVFGGVANVLTPEARRLAALAEERFGIPLDAAQKTGNRTLQSLNAAFENMPATAGKEIAKKNTQRNALTREVMKTMGEQAEEATADTLTRGAKRIGGDFERIFSKVHVNLDDDAVQAGLAKVVQEAADTLPQEQAAIVVKRVGQLLDKIDDNGAVAGKAYQAWRSQVQKQAQGTQDRWLGEQLRSLYRAVDDVAYRSAADVGEDAALKTAREQYRNMKIIEPLVAKSEDGVISPSLLRGEVMKRVPDYAKGGGGDISQLAKVAREFIADQVPNSGTAQRMMAQGLVSGGTLGGVGWAASGDPMTGAKMAAGALLLPKAVQAALNSGAIQSRMVKGLGPVELALLERAVRGGAYGPLQGLGE
jgi:hypothetical protein